MTNTITGYFVVLLCYAAMDPLLRNLHLFLCMLPCAAVLGLLLGISKMPSCLLGIRV